MEIETLFTEQKWNILASLADKKQSPLQLSKRLNTSMANISQQLRLLEAFGLVKKEKIPNRDKGKPRTLFSLKKNYAYLISATGNYADKRLIELDSYHDILLRIWFIKNSNLHYFVEKAFWKIEPYLDSMDIVAFKEETDKLGFVVVSKKGKELEKKLPDFFIKNIFGETKNFDVKILSQEQFKKSSSDYFVIYDPNSLAKKEVIT